MIDRRELLSGAVLLATSAAISGAWTQALATIKWAATIPEAVDDRYAEAMARAAKVGPSGI